MSDFIRCNIALDNGNCARPVGHTEDHADDEELHYLGIIAGLEQQKNGAYSERNQVVALLAKMAAELGLKTGVRQHEGADWEDDWRTILFIELPSGQVSWHFHDSERHLLEGLPEYSGSWDGHDTTEKYRRVNNPKAGAGNG